jgi:phosphoserine phosphatase
MNQMNRRGDLRMRRALKHPDVKSLRQPLVLLLWVLLVSTRVGFAQDASDPLPSWNNGSAKRSIVDFVASVTKAGGPDFVPPEERVATFDNDGTLWSEQPMYVELAYTLDKVAEMAPSHPEWQRTQPFAAVLHHDLKALEATGEIGIMKLFIATHTGMTADAFSKSVSDWLAKTQHPKFHRPYTECVFQPMLELMAYLRANGFKTYIVSGGEQGFMRPFTEKVYGVPPEQVIGTQFESLYTMKGETPVIERSAGVLSIDDGPGKPENIERFIGRKPIASFGNSDGDIQMLEWTESNTRPHLELLVHHTDAEREYAYDRNSSMGRLDKGLSEAAEKHWVVVDMKTDWKAMFPAPKTADLNSN